MDLTHKLTHIVYVFRMCISTAFRSPPSSRLRADEQLLKVAPERQG